MTLFRAQVALQGKSGLAADRFVNNFTLFEHPTPAGDLDDVVDTLWAFYNNTGAQWPIAVRGYLSPTVAQNGHSVKIYNLDEPAPRAPVRDVTKNFTAAPSGTPLPSEVAMTISWRGQRVSGTIDARRRGRIFVGPLNTGNGIADANGELRPSGTPVTNMLNAFTNMVVTLNGFGYLLGVTSSREEAGNFTPLRDLWVDNAFDTQRRRGPKPTTKVLASVTQIALAA